MSFCYFLSPRNTLRVFRIETTWRLREIVVSALFLRGIQGPCGDLAGDYFSSDCFQKLYDSYFKQYYSNIIILRNYYFC